MTTARKYPPEIRERAVRMVLEIGERGAVAGVDEQLDINRETLRSWVRRSEIDRGLRDGITTEQREELNKLRRENFGLRRANEILKSASHGTCARHCDAQRRRLVHLRAQSRLQRHRLVHVQS
jgi:transposase